MQDFIELCDSKWHNYKVVYTKMNVKRCLHVTLCSCCRMFTRLSTFFWGGNRKKTTSRYCFPLCYANVSWWSHIAFTTATESIFFFEPLRETKIYLEYRVVQENFWLKSFSCHKATVTEEKRDLCLKKVQTGSFFCWATFVYFGLLARRL